MRDVQFLWNLIPCKEPFSHFVSRGPDCLGTRCYRVLGYMAGLSCAFLMWLNSMVFGKTVIVDKLSSPPHPILPLLGALYYAGLIKLQIQSWLNQCLAHPPNGCSHPHFPTRAMFVSCCGIRHALLPLYSVVLAVSQTPLKTVFLAKQKTKKNSVKCFL
ncbi:hypothetical protein ACRRTK_009294 [Alexandromys fortis]